MAVDGSQTGYALLSLQLLLVPVLFIVQEMVVRVTVCQKQGLLRLVRGELGRWSAGLFALTMTFEGTVSMVSEFSGFAAAGELYGLSRRFSCMGGAAAMVSIVLASDYKRIERVCMGLGTCLGVFIIALFL